MMYLQAIGIGFCVTIGVEIALGFCIALGSLKRGGNK